MDYRYAVFYKNWQPYEPYYGSAAHLSPDNGMTILCGRTADNLEVIDTLESALGEIPFYFVGAISLRAKSVTVCKHCLRIAQQREHQE